MLALFLTILFAAVISLKLLPVVSGTTQEFTDFIIENVSSSGLNKSAELSLFWAITIGGAIFMCLLLFLYEKRQKKAFPASAHTTAPTLQGSISPLTSDDCTGSHTDAIFCPCLCLCATAIPFFVYLILYKQVSLPLLFFAGLSLFGMINRKADIRTMLLIYVLTYYGIVSVLSFGCNFTTHFVLSSSRIYILTLLIGTAFLLLIHVIRRLHPGSLFAKHLILLLQCLMPGLFSVYLIDKYLYQDSIIRVRYATGYYVFFEGLIAVLFFILICHAIRYFREKKDDIICFVTPMIIFAYHSFCAAPMYAQPDQHHHGEQMIPFNQIFEHGQSLYDTYTPVSGLFPFVNGFIQHGLLGGTVTDYAPAISITMVIFCFIIMFLICKHIGGSKALLFAVLFTLPCYNRQYMVLPALLLLTLPGLLKKPALWIFSYILTSFLSGLYYPLFGAAVMLALIPVCLWEIRALWEKSRRSKAAFLSISYLILYVALFAVIACSIPMLFRMLKHTLTYSSQTILADGIALSNQTAPDFFLPYLAGMPTLRLYLYMALRFLLPAIGIWLLLYFAYRALRKKDIYLSLLLVAGIITLVISYSYTLVRADVGKVLSRTGPILIAVIGMYLPVYLLSHREILKEKKSNLLAFGFCLSLPFIVYMQISQTKNPDLWVYPDGDAQLVMDDGSKLFAYYTVPDTFLKSEDTDLAPRYQALLGDGFMVADQVHYIKEYAQVVEKCEQVSEDVTYMALDGQGFFDYLGITCYGTGYIPAARSLKAQQEIWDSDPENLPVVFYIQPEYDYYIFRFMMDAGYLYNHEDHAFYPPKLYDKLYAAGLASGYDDYRNDCSPLDLGLSAASFGNSYDSFIKNNVLTSETDPSDIKELTGESYDAMYLEFAAKPADNLLVTISFTDTEGNSPQQYQTTCRYGDGKLLIPLGMNACWSLSDISSFTVSLTDTDSNIPLYSVTYYYGNQQAVEIAGENSAVGNNVDQNNTGKNTANESDADQNILTNILLYKITLDR